MSLTPELKSHFLTLYQMALSDSQVDTRELEMLYSLGESRGVTRSDIDKLLIDPKEVAYIQPATVLEKIDYLYDLSLIAWADGTVDVHEQKALELFCTRFGFREENIAGICEYLLDAASKNTPKQQLLSTIAQHL